MVILESVAALYVISPHVGGFSGEMVNGFAHTKSFTRVVQQIIDVALQKQGQMTFLASERSLLNILPYCSNRSDIVAKIGHQNVNLILMF
jgi:hypothetical protein